MGVYRSKNPLSTARFVTEIFFPQRVALKIDGRSYSPAVIEKTMFCAGTLPAYHLASKSLLKLSDISITGRHIGNLSESIGNELARERDARTQVYFDQNLPRVHVEPSTPIPLAVVSVDGGRMQTRTIDSANGVQDPHWRETKNALFMRMSGVSFDADPHPALPACFQDRNYMKKLLSGLADEGDFTPQSIEETSKSDLRSWRPERLYRTCLSSLSNSKTFGRMMEAEADCRGFFKAAKQAFVCDGLQYNWSIQQEHFPTFTPILDFPHAIERLHETAKALHPNGEKSWKVYVRWITAVWQGRVTEVLQEMKRIQIEIGAPSKDCEDKDARKVLSEAVTYFSNNQSRMDYPRYRRQGLAITSAHMESLVKEIGYRVKGTEKFWNDGTSAEAILQIRAAALSDDDRLAHHLRNRPGSPFQPNVKLTPTESSAA